MVAAAQATISLSHRIGQMVEDVVTATKDISGKTGLDSFVVLGMLHQSANSRYAADRQGTSGLKSTSETHNSVALGLIDRAASRLYLGAQGIARCSRQHDAHPQTLIQNIIHTAQEQLRASVE